MIARHARSNAPRDAVGAHPPRFIRIGVMGVVASLVLMAAGCATSPRDHWVKVHRHRIEPLTDVQIAALDTWSDESTMGIAVAIAGENWSMFAAAGE